MSKKVSLDDVAFYAKELKLEDQKVNELLQKLSDSLDSEQKEKQQRPKKMFILVADIEKFPQDFKDKADEVFNSTPLYLTQVNEDYSHEELLPQLNKMKEFYNANKPKKKAALESISDVFHMAQAKLFKEKEIVRKSKEPLLITF